jgi:hypothetical protein
MGQPAMAFAKMEELKENTATQTTGIPFPRYFTSRLEAR